MNVHFWRRPLLALLWAAALVSPAVGQDAKNPIDTRLDEVRALSRSGNVADAQKAASILSAIPASELSETQVDTWVSQSRTIALQLGDWAKLQELSEKKTSFPPDKTYEVLWAYGKLARADLSGAKPILERLSAEKLNPREERRVFALRAKIGQLEGDPQAELENLEKMLDHLPDWPTANCQSCHNDPKNPERMTAVPFSDLWFGNRYAELLHAQGTAPLVRDYANTALAKDPHDVAALIRLGFAMRALEDETAAQSAFQRIQFAKESGQSLSAPRMFFSFP